MSVSDKRSRTQEVTVIYFPKGGRPAPLRRSKTQTLPEIPAPVPVEDPVTESYAVSLDELDGPAPKRRGRNSSTTNEAVLPEAALGQLVRTSTRDQLIELSQLGHQLFESGRVDEARSIFEGMVTSDNATAFAHTMLGTIYLSGEDPHAAAQQFDRALKLDPTDIAARVYRGEVRLFWKKLKAAEDDLTRAINVGQPDDPFVDRAKRLLKRVKAQARKAQS